MIKAVIEISDMLFKGFGQAILENLFRDYYLLQNERSLHSYAKRFIDIASVIAYATFHSLLLTMEMFTIHVALTSSDDSVFSFLFYNNFTELKITVFKKVDIPGLYQYACNDGVERLQLLLYLANIYLTTSQDKSKVLWLMGVVLASEMLIDWIKHFFITRLNRLNTGLYGKFEVCMFSQFINRVRGQSGRAAATSGNDQSSLAGAPEEWSGEDNPQMTEAKKAYKFYNAALLDRMLDPETSMGMAANLLVIP
jgi:hypothetical protein